MKNLRDEAESIYKLIKFRDVHSISEYSRIIDIIESKLIEIRYENELICNLIETELEVR